MLDTNPELRQHIGSVQAWAKCMHQGSATPTAVKSTLRKLAHGQRVPGNLIAHARPHAFGHCPAHPSQATPLTSQIAATGVVSAAGCFLHVAASARVPRRLSGLAAQVHACSHHNRKLMCPCMHAACRRLPDFHGPLTTPGPATAAAAGAMGSYKSDSSMHQCARTAEPHAAAGVPG